MMQATEQEPVAELILNEHNFKEFLSISASSLPVGTKLYAAPPDLEAQIAQLRDMLEACAKHLRPTCDELYCAATNVLAAPNNSADWLRKHDADLLQRIAKGQDHIGGTGLLPFELRRMAAELEGVKE